MVKSQYFKSSVNVNTIHGQLQVQKQELFIIVKQLFQIIKRIITAKQKHPVLIIPKRSKIKSCNKKRGNILKTTKTASLEGNIPKQKMEYVIGVAYKSSFHNACNLSLFINSFNAHFTSSASLSLSTFSPEINDHFSLHSSDIYLKHLIRSVLTHVKRRLLYIHVSLSFHLCLWMFIYNLVTVWMQNDVSQELGRYRIVFSNFLGSLVRIIHLENVFV